MPKYEELAALLEKRILRGDYALTDLPTEQELADEVGISRMTARRTLLHLIEKGLIHRPPHGRLQINRRHEKIDGKPSIGLLLPAFHALQYENWAHAAEQAAEKAGVNLRVVHYVHWNAPVIAQALSTFDGVFLVPNSETIPVPTLKLLSGAPKLVILDGDLTEWGVPSLQAPQQRMLSRLGEHLITLGHRRIDCLNTQPHDRTIARRLYHWAAWKMQHRIQGNVIDQPVQPYTEPTEQGYQIMCRLLESGPFLATALFCTTSAAAEGAVRAFYEHGVRVCQDVSVCSLDGGQTSRYAIPSRTAFYLADWAPHLERCLDWMTSNSAKWDSPLLVEPADMPLFLGESTGPAPSPGL